MLIKKTLHFMLLILIVIFISSLEAKVTLKVGVLAPEGTTWANELKIFAKEVDTATKGEVEFKIFCGGTQGDEPTVLRKIRSGQLQGGIFTGRTLGEINGDVRLMEIPFTFKHDRELAYKTLVGMSDYFSKNFLKNQFQNFGLFEIGQVYLITTKKAESFEQLKGIKIWTWQGDVLASTMVESMNLVSVPMALPDVLSALSTGIVEAAYAPAMAILAVQWQTKVKYLINYPMTYSIGAFLLHDRDFKKIPAQYQKVVADLAKKATTRASEKTVGENEEALASMKNLGIQFVNFADKDIEEGSKVRLKVIEKLNDKLFSKDALATFEKTMNSLKTGKK